MQDLRGTRIDRYIIQEEIGRGGMSRVYRAHDPELGRDVALKILQPDMAGDEAGVARFLREARAAGNLDHPHIVPIYDTGQADDSYFIAMKYLQGRTLRELLGERPLGVPEVRDYLAQIASALDYAHARGTVHRDIKPENIMAGANGTVTLTDFGIANAIDEASVTTTGNIVGTPVYMAPEQLRGELVSARSDIYALGILVYELLSGAAPFAGRAPYAVMLAQIEEQPAPLHQKRGDVPAALSAVVGRALEKDPAARYASAGEFSQEFIEAAGNVDGGQVAFPLADQPTNGAATYTTRIGGPLLAGVSSVASTQVSSQAATGRKLPAWRYPWWTGAAAAGVLLVFVLAGLGALSDRDDPIAEDSDPAIVPPVETPTHEPPSTSTTETEIVVPVVEDTPSPTAVVEDVPSPTAVIEDVPSATAVVEMEPSPTAVVEVEPSPTVVVEEQPTEAPSPPEETPGNGPPAESPGEGPGDQEEKPDKEDKEKKDKKQNKDEDEKNGDDDDSGDDEDAD